MVRGKVERLRVTAVLERWRRFFVGMGVRRGLDERHGWVDREDTIETEENGGDGDGGFLRSALQDRRDSEIQRPFSAGTINFYWCGEEHGVRREFSRSATSTPKVGIMTALSSKENNVTTSTSHETALVDQSDEQDDSFPTTRLHDEADVGEDEDIGGGFS
jgi:hypothetical protein